MSPQWGKTGGSTDICTEACSKLIVSSVQRALSKTGLFINIQVQYFKNISQNEV